MNKDKIKSELKNIVEPYVQDQEAFEDLEEDTDFINDLKVNSANLVDIVLDVEDKFDIEIDNESMEQMMDVKSSMDIIEAKIEEKQ